MAAKPKLTHADLEPVGPGTPSGRYLRLFWQPVMRGKDLPTGRAKPLEILGEKFTIYRGEDGTPHVTAFRCAHRGTQLSIGWVEGDTLRCRYHGWRFDGAGQCVEQPNEDRPFCDKVKIPSYPTREYVGLIFAYLGEGEPPPFRHYPDFDLPGVVIADPVEILPCTFWNRVENDPGHRAWVHRATALRKNRPDVLSIHHEDIEATDYGWRAFRSIASSTDKDVRSSIGLVKGRNQSSAQSLNMARYKHYFMPNTRLWFQRSRAEGYGDRDLWETKIVWTVPINDTSHAAFDVTHTPLVGEEGRRYEKSRIDQQEREAETRWDLAEKILAGEMTLEDLPDEMGAYTSFTIEDYTTQVGQGPVKGRGVENLAPTDMKPLRMRRLWLKEIEAMLEGRPMTEWQPCTEPLSLQARKSVDA